MMFAAAAVRAAPCARIQHRTPLLAPTIHQRWLNVASNNQQHSPGFRNRVLLANDWFRNYGWRLARVNPLRRDGFMASSVKSSLPVLLQPLVEHLREAREKNAPLVLPILNSEEEPLIRMLLSKYCGNVGYEFMHCATERERQFFVDAIEGESSEFSDKDAIWCFEQVFRAGAFERMLQKRYPTCRRFSIEGLESAILALNTVMDEYCVPEYDPNDKQRVVLGTLHRGRVSFIHNVLQRSVESLLSDWDATDGPTYDDITVGHSADITTRCGGQVHISLLAMPAHLESQDASVAGKARGHMTARALEQGGDTHISEHIANSVLPILVHGDASFCGQGIVAETLQLSTFQDFDSFGSIHLILNNQIGFTCETQAIRKSDSLIGVSDVALSIRAPVLHVNAESPLDVFRAATLAARYRQEFHKDIILDIWGFRKHGHNEVDDPRITNIKLYQEVDTHEPVADVFAATMSHSVGEECRHVRDRIEKEYEEVLEAPYSTTQMTARGDEKSKSGEWVTFLKRPVASVTDTGVSLEDLRLALETLSTVPEGFTLHQATARAVTRRAELFEELKAVVNDLISTNIDWATAELLTLCTLAKDGHFVRLCGQDSQRGTFGQRHAVWHDAVTGKIHQALPPSVQVVDSPLSELGVLGFESGFSLASPSFLVLWEAQFADFANNSQVLIDTMIASEKEKFGIESNLVLLLPHGYDGMGPEHSSARLERFLTLHTDTVDAAEEIKDELERHRAANFVVTYPTSPSNYFHLLRRSFSWPFRRPMIVLTPKRTLRLVQAASPLTDFIRRRDRVGFSPVLDDPRHVNNDTRGTVESIAFCSGELYFDVASLLDNLPEEVARRVALLRVEQLAPFPLNEVRNISERYPNARRAVWMQEEPGNMGAMRFVAPFLARAFGGRVDASISRPVSAAPAIGNPRDHQASQHDLMSKIEAWVRRE